MMQQAERCWPDLSGKIDGHRHILPIRVYFEDTDFSGFVYHTSYLRWCERGRSDFIRLLGVHHNELIAPKDGGTPAAFVVRHMEVDYLRPAQIDEELEVITECTTISRAYFTLTQEIRRRDTALCRVKVKVALISLEGKPQRIPTNITEKLKVV